MLVLCYTVVHSVPLGWLHLFDEKVHHGGGGILLDVLGVVVPVPDQHIAILPPVVLTPGEPHHCTLQDCTFPPLLGELRGLDYYCGGI